MVSLPEEHIDLLPAFQSFTPRKCKLFQWHKGIKTKSPRLYQGQYLVDKNSTILVPSHLKLSACDGLYFGDSQEPYDHWRIACVCEIREPFYGVCDEAGMYVS